LAGREALRARLRLALADRRLRLGDARLDEELGVEGRVLLAALGPAVEALHLRAQERREERVDPEVRADHRVVVLRLRAVRPQQARFLGERVVVCRDEAAVAEAVEVL